MTYLILHIIISILALIGTSSLLYTAWLSRQSLKKSILKIAGLFTSGSIATGILLMFQGASVARVCIESGVLIALNAVLIIYSRRLELIRAKVQ